MGSNPTLSAFISAVPDFVSARMLRLLDPGWLKVKQDHDIENQVARDPVCGEVFLFVVDDMVGANRAHKVQLQFLFAPEP